jgi:PST family polysaccharide transporter
VPLINSLGLIFSGILAFVLSIKIFKLEIKKPSFSSVVCQFREGWHVFVSTIAVSIYTISTIFILGIFTNNTIVGYYSAAEKIIKAFRSLLNPISQAVYPHINKTASISKKRALIFINKLTNFVGAGTFVVSLLIFFSSGFIVKIFLGSQYAQSIVVLKILAFLPFLIGLSNILGIQTMLTFNFKKAFSRILVLAGALNVVLVFFLIPLFQHIGAAIALFITEFFVAIFMFLFLKKKGINIFNVNRYE